MNKEDEKSVAEIRKDNLITSIVEGEKMLIVRDSVPKDSVGITIVFGDYQTHGTLRIKEHKEFMLHLTDVLEAERIAIAQQNGSEEE
tara:strand:+ start:613 stop:873 length:261 start_codon:yes stop_codon:yes gene_type:complete